MSRSAVFDRVVIVDWSANSTPKTGKDSIWIAECVIDSRAPRAANVSTRAAATDLLFDLVTAPGRCLVGVDFSLGFPSGTAAALDLDGTPWASLWELLDGEVVDDERNANNRFEVASAWNARISPGPGPFWGCPPTQVTDVLTTTKAPAHPLPDWRATERRLHERGSRPFSCWQLLGAGAVGSQSLLGIAALSRLVARTGAAGRTVDVWPFTSGFRAPIAEVVFVEIWPTLAEVPDTSGDVWDTRVRDQVQVETLAAELAGADLGPHFVPAVDDTTAAVAVGEEGWVFNS